MLLIDCPYCGKRPELEFTYGGQAHLVRPPRPADLDDQHWTDFLYMRTNVKGVYAERWRHARGCGRFFNAVRDTTTDHFLAFYKSGTLPPAAIAARVAPAPGAATAVPGLAPAPHGTGLATLSGIDSPAPGPATAPARKGDVPGGTP